MSWRASPSIWRGCHLVGEALERWQAAAQAREIVLRARSGSRPQALRGALAADADRAVDALLENALSYSPPRSAVTVASDAGRIEVCDRGPGLTDEESDAVFERFHRGRAGQPGQAEAASGWRSHGKSRREWGGDVTLRNREGGGAVATLTLPAGAPGAMTRPCPRLTIEALP